MRKFPPREQSGANGPNFTVIPFFRHQNHKVIFISIACHNIYIYIYIYIFLFQCFIELRFHRRYKCFPRSMRRRKKMKMSAAAAIFTLSVNNSNTQVYGRGSGPHVNLYFVNKIEVGQSSEKKSDFKQ
ncbi:hypothetical protein JOB18_037507 [Solea senegalensis]|uniref:Uncharacterized protein n=1 Tax=Solea senegalensis TaxID=28829 RepID=A0AAV6RP85_SOLSE|nr:hypothetical protein JOB18_037507 [Solea senegalensis]